MTNYVLRAPVQFRQRRLKFAMGPSLRSERRSDMSAIGGRSQPVDATLYLKEEMECGLMGHRFHRGFTAAEKTELMGIAGSAENC